jgi:nicotinamidase/pyrazinamidase
MSSKLKAHLVIIDPQVDFMDLPGSALPVPGADADMKRLASLIRRIGPKIDDIHVTLDSHRVIDVGHPAMWRNQAGESPEPFTIITVDDLVNGIWLPRNAQARLPQLGGQSLGEYVLDYARTLAAEGNYPLMVWPQHCVIGTPGHNVHSELMAALQQWERQEFANVNFVTKGANPFTEHYGALQAEVPMASDPSSGVNTAFLDILSQADIVVVAGEALSHCVRSTVTQIADKIGEQHVQKFHILTDCTSPVPKVGDGPDFPAIAGVWLKDMERRGMTLTTSTDFLA